jgi:hypothetical protein
MQSRLQHWSQVCNDFYVLLTMTMKVVIWNVILYSPIDVADAPEECAASGCGLEDGGSHSSKTPVNIYHQAAQCKFPEDSNVCVEYCLRAECGV